MYVCSNIQGHRICLSLSKGEQWRCSGKILDLSKTDPGEKTINPIAPCLVPRTSVLKYLDGTPTPYFAACSIHMSFGDGSNPCLQLSLADALWLSVSNILGFSFQPSFTITASCNGLSQPLHAWIPLPNTA